MLKSKEVGLTAAAVGLVLAAAAFAQGTRAQMPSGMPGMGMMNKGAGTMGMMRMMADCPMMVGGETSTHSEGRIAFLEAELAITDAQKEAWDGYAAALTKNFQAMQGTRQGMMRTMEAKSPVERLDGHIAAMEGRAAALKDIRPALVTLYSALSEEQKQKADQLLTGMGCMM